MTDAPSESAAPPPPALVEGGVELVCQRCGRTFQRKVRRGPLPLYCRDGCRQRAYEQRRAQREAAARVDLRDLLEQVRRRDPELAPAVEAVRRELRL